MPILDPILQFNLSIIPNNKTADDLKNFYSNYLQLASEQIDQNYNTILASFQFKKDFEECMPVISKYLSFTFHGQKEEFPNIYYSILYQNCALEKPKLDFQGDYYKYSIFNSQFYFFKLNIDNSLYRSWFFTDYPTAILSIHLNQLKDEDLNQLIFELDLIAAAGFTLVVCLNQFQQSKITDYNKFIEILYGHFISEIHITFNNNQYDDSFHKFIEALNKNYDNFDCYIYFYVRYFMNYQFKLNFDKIVPIKQLNNDTNNESKTENDNSLLINEIIKIMKELESYPRMKIIYFNEPIEKSLKKLKLISNKPFTYCKHGFDKKEIKILLSDVPLYPQIDDQKCLFSCDFANIENFKYHCYMNKDDFLSSEKNRVKLAYIFEKKSKGGKIEKAIRYADLDDIHYMNSELYVNSQLSLIEIRTNIKDKCNAIINKLENNFVPKEPEIKPTSKPSPRKKKKDTEEEISIPDKIEQTFTSSLYELKKNFDKKNDKKFEFNLSQIYTAYEIIDSCFSFDFSRKIGSIYQIPTGEGKSAIILLIAAVIAQMNKKVHIVTSNYFLANRDYNESFEYFNKLGLKSAALLHYNEVPFYNKIDNDPSILRSHYPDNYFGLKLFDNPMRINFDICKEENDASIIFSTLTNFECFYLYMTEKSKMNIDDYYKNTILLVDEADSILIDEIANGTIISRPLNSNCEDILSYVYKEYISKKRVSKNEILKHIKENWPECTDLTKKDIEEMFKEIELVNNDISFTNGKKYIIINTNKKPKVENKDISQYREIVPFDFENKGIIERNKEYNGFIEQFIAIKERILNKNKDILFKDISLNYLYISHPVYVKLYKNVFGVTGTIDDSYDKGLLLKHYKLNTKIMPKNYPNRCCHFPTTLCDNLDQRNELIVDEIIGFHKNGFPVLVILFSPKEIEIIENLIKEHPEFKQNQNIQIYKGENIKIKASNESGKEGVISLGTNVCGRGFHIEVDKKHLHVIISFYSSNNRTLKQAFGRTSRKNNFGSVHIICMRKEFDSFRKFIKDNELEDNLRKMEIFKNKQKEFIDEIRKSREWIFDINFEYTKKLNKDDLRELRIPKINVNRINASKFKYPICMNYSTFLDIQSQKIFSLINCPNCKFTWKLFQQYIREMVLQSWSIFINKSNILFYCNSTSIRDIEPYINDEKIKLLQKLKEYLPDDNSKTDVFSTFLHIFQKVYKKYEFIKIVPIIPISCAKNKINYDIDVAEKSGQNKKKVWNKFSRISLEFRPFSLIYKSGSRIRETFKKSNEISYIEDPELKYKREKTDEVFSITNIIDNVFDKICNILNDFLEDHINFKLFLRRTLAGCEFGICYDFDIENVDPKVKELVNCLFDKNPIFVFCIYINSIIPFLSGILVFLLVYLTVLIKKLITFAKEIIKDLAVESWKLFKAIIDYFAEDAYSKAKEKVCDKFTSYLEGKIMNIIEFLKNTEYERYYYIISLLTKILTGKEIEKYYDKSDDFVQKMADKINQKGSKKGLNALFKVGFLCVLWLASYMLDFQLNFLFRDKLMMQSVEKESESLQKNHSEDSINKSINNNVKNVITERLKLDNLLKDELIKMFPKQ